MFSSIGIRASSPRTCPQQSHKHLPNSTASDSTCSKIFIADSCKSSKYSTRARLRPARILICWWLPWTTIFLALLNQCPACSNFRFRPSVPLTLHCTFASACANEATPSCSHTLACFTASPDPSTNLRFSVNFSMQMLSLPTYNNAEPHP